MRIQVAREIVGAIDRDTVVRGVLHVTQGLARSLEDLIADLEVVGALPEVLGRLAADVGIGFVQAARLAEVFEARVLLGVAVGDLVAGDVGAHQRIERAGSIAEVHVLAVPVRILVVRPVMDAHDKLERERIGTGVGVVHVLDDAAEEVRVVDRRIGAIDGLEGVARACIGECGAAAGAAIEVDRLHVGVVHGAGGAALCHV